MKKFLLGEITSFLARGAAPKYTEKDDFYVLNQKCIRDWRVSLKYARFTDTEAKKVHDDRILRDNDILVNSTGQGTLGRVAQFLKLDSPATVDSHITIVRPTPDLVFPEYLGYVLKGRQNEIELLAEGSTGQTELSKLKLANLSIDLPPLDQQKKIANILGSLDEKIELNRRMNETLEQLGQALFRHYFVDNPEAKDWENIYLGDIVAITTGKGSNKANLSEYGKYPLYGANGIMGRSQSYLLNEKVIITGRVGTLGVVRAVVDEAWFSDNVIIMKPDPSIFGYVFYVVCGIDYTSLNRGSTQPLITQTDLKNQRVKLPPRSILQRFENSYAAIFNQIQANKRQMSTLVAIRDSLLPKLISGEIEV